MSRAMIKALGHKGETARSFVGKMWTDNFLKGFDEVEITVGDETILLKREQVYVRYGNEEDHKAFDDYRADMRSKGWRWCASYGYDVFEKEDNHGE